MKKVLSLTLAVLMLVTCVLFLASCDAASSAGKKLEKAGYTVKTMNNDEIKEELGEEFAAKVKSATYAVKGISYLRVYVFATEQDAADYCALSFDSSILVRKQEGKVVYAGSTAAYDLVK